MRFLLALAVVMLAAPALSAPARAQAPLSLEGSAAPSPWHRYRGWNKTHWDNYNTLANPNVTPPHGAEIVMKEVTGDPEKGQKLAFDRSRGGGCLACHVMGPRTLEAPGNVGPDLSEIGKAGRTDQWLFNYVYDARVYNPKSVMPPWGKHGFYSEAEIRDIVAFLKTLKMPAKFADPLDDPAQRPRPVEDRDALDPFVNPAADHIGAGTDLFMQACVSCHATPEQTFKRWAVEMPKWEPRLKKVLGVEEFITRHAKATSGKDWLMQSRENTDLSVYLHSLANGETIKVDLSAPEAKAAYEKASIDISTLDKRIAHVMQASFNGRRIVVFSGGEAKDLEGLFAEIRGLRDGGANGSIIGRNTFQRPRDEALDMLDKIIGIYQGKM